MVVKHIFHGAKIVSAVKTNNLKSVKKRHNFTNCFFQKTVVLTGV